MGLLRADSVVHSLHRFRQLGFPRKISFLSHFDNREKLDKYIERGKVISKNPSKSLLQLEDLIKGHDKSEIYSKLLRTEEYQSHGATDQYFIALIHPRMTGKTQMAFNIRSKRPIYFVTEKDHFISHISEKFSSLLKTDFENAREEAKLVIGIDEVGMSEAEIEDLMDKANDVITLDFLKKYLLHHKFESLGFIVSLIKVCDKLYKEESNDGWMRFYTDHQKLLHSLKFKPISLAELENQKDLFEKYFFFMDDFLTKPGFIMFRDMCRYLKTPCVLTSSSTEMLDTTNYGSGSPSASVFCAVIPKLPAISHEEIEKFFNEEIKCGRFLKLARKVSESEERRMSLLLQFFKDQAKMSRPGVSLYLFKALKEISTKCSGLESLKVDGVFHKVIKSMLYSIHISSDHENIKLLGGKKFDPKYMAPESIKLDESSFIEDHFFYMKNPRNAEEPYLLFRNILPSYRLLLQPNSDQKFEIQAYFDEKEELLKLACLLYNMYDSSYEIIEERSTAKELEVVTYAAFLKSSNYDEDKSFSLKGVKIKDFLKNLIANLDKESEMKRSYGPKLELSCEAVKDDHMMAGTVVPCLYTINHDWPAELKAIFDPKESSFKLGKYMRNLNGIDAVVDLIDKDGRNCFGVIECKNRKGPVSEAEYRKIIENALEYAKVNKIEQLRPLIKSNMIESFESYIIEKDFEDSSKLKDFIKEEHLNEFDNLNNNLKSTSPLIHFLICKSCSDLKSLERSFSNHKINFFRFEKTVKEIEIFEKVKNVKDDTKDIEEWKKYEEWADFDKWKTFDKKEDKKRWRYYDQEEEQEEEPEKKKTQKIVEFKVKNLNSPLHKEPDMVAFIIETDIINQKEQ